MFLFGILKDTDRVSDILKRETVKPHRINRGESVTKNGDQNGDEEGVAQPV